MFEYELHKVMHAELLRRADLQRLAGEATRARRVTRRAARRTARQEAEGPVSTGGVRDRFTHAA
ncbi:hypothetical protein ACGFR6_18895 [Streptomyces sp. NPDC048567]|uniref:hypothetical protein n=1 Tax=unclassified Streptomyces TaxID=2593676 RepID=UPI001370DA34|nr:MULTISPECIES: hypothetical protein [unclassified Streptomyces]MYW12779.1 hypothetical protein [Streptomyces sp. SID2563]WUD02532.1 hypothetical protein OHS17_24075 [Streptomyces sp. NBC_00523]